MLTPMSRTASAHTGSWSPLEFKRIRPGERADPTPFACTEYQDPAGRKADNAQFKSPTRAFARFRTVAPPARNIASHSESNAGRTVGRVAVYAGRSNGWRNEGCGSDQGPFRTRAPVSGALLT